MLFMFHIGLALKFWMEMRRIVLLMNHSYNDSEKSGDSRHILTINYKISYE